MSPDGSTRPSPEEKLLKLIRGKGPRSETAAPGGLRPGEAGANAVAVSGLNARVRQLRWPRLAAVGLGTLLAIEVVYLTVQLTRPLPTFRVPVVEPLPPAQPAGPVASPTEVPSLATSASPQLFTPLIAAPAPTTQSPQTRSSPSSMAKMLAARLTLMGIVSGEPAQAIIEDSQTKKTYFVTTGQSVVEGAVLEQVLDTGVVLDLNGEKIELTL